MTSANVIQFKKTHLVFGLLTVVGLLGLVIPIPALSGPDAPTQRVLRIEASSFAFDPGVVVVNTGDQVTIELVSTDVVHGLHLDGYGLQVSSDPGQTSTLTFTADRPGTFRFRCSVTCGALHPFMIGKLKVGSNTIIWRGVGLAIFAAFAMIVWVRYETA